MTKPLKPSSLILSLLSLLALYACSPTHFESGLKAFESKDYAAAKQQWELADKDGDASAQNAIGWMYEQGLVGPPDPKQAASWYRKAAQQNHDGALLNLGNLYDDGVGVDKNYPVAAEAFEKAAILGNAEAQNNLGRMYQTGQGVPQDQTTASAWLKRAAKQGFAPAQNSLGLQYFKGQGVTQSAEEALFWLQLATLSGLPGAEHNRDFSRTFVDAEKILGIEAKVARWKPRRE